MLIRCWGNTSCKNKPINYTFRPLQYCQISVKSMQWEKKNASYRRRARLAVAANDRTRKYIIRLTSSAMTLSLIAKEIFLDIRPVMDTAKGNLPFLAPVLSSSSLMELVTETLASLCAAWKPISLYPKDIKSSAPPQATHWLPRRLALLLPLPFNLGPTNQRLDKMLVERHLISDLLKHTGDRKQGCRAPEIGTFSVGPTPCLPDGKHWETLSGEITMMPLKRQVIFDWIFLQTVCASLTQYFFFLLVDRFGFLDAFWSQFAVRFLGCFKSFMSHYFSHAGLCDRFGGLSRQRSACRRKRSSHAVFASFLVNESAWRLKGHLRLQKLFLARHKRMCFCSVGSLAMCFVLEWCFMLQYLGSTPHVPLLQCLTAGRIPQYLTCHGEVVCRCGFRPPSQTMRYGGGSSIRPKLGKPKRRSEVIQIVRVTTTSRKWFEILEVFHNLASVKELITCPGWQMWRGRCCMTLAICTDSIFFFLHLFLVCQLGGEKNTLVSFLRSRKSIEHQHPSLTPTP